MRIIILLPLIICSFASCKKENIVACIQKSQHPAWETIVFKYDYTIQLPAGYRGIGAIGFEGYVFSKNRADSTVLLDYAYCSPTFCAPFGQALAQPDPDFVNHTFRSNRQLILTLDQKVKFCENDSTVAIFYYNKKEERFGKLYMKVGGDFREAIEVTYVAAKQPEVEAILKTIK